MRSVRLVLLKYQIVGTAKLQMLKRLFVTNVMEDFSYLRIKVNVRVAKQRTAKYAIKREIARIVRWDTS